MKGLPPGWQTDIIKALGGQHSAPGEHLLGAWQQWEGGGTANDADYNPLNTTIGSYPKMNSVGVSVFPNWQTGVKETVSTLSAYPALSEAIRTGRVDFSDPKLQADFNYWLTGKRTPGMTPYVSKIARSFGQNVPLSETKATTNSAYAAPTTPPPPPVKAAAAKPISLMDIALGKRSIMDMFFQKRPSATTLEKPALPAFSAEDALTGTEAGQGGWTAMPTNSQWQDMKPGQFKAGLPVPKNGLLEIQGLHDTGGLPGYPAHDYMARAGTPVVAPVGGKIVKLSGHDPALGPVDGVHGPFGLSLYLQGTDGRTYYMTHLGSRDVQDGQRIAPGQVLGTVGNYAKWGGADHVHMGIHDGGFGS